MAFDQETVLLALQPIEYSNIRQGDITQGHKRRIYIEDEAKVVAAGQHCFNSFAALAILHQDELKNILISTLFFNFLWCIYISADSSTRPGAK